MSPTSPGRGSAETAYLKVSSQAKCIVTRVQLKHWWQLPLAYLRFRQLDRVRHDGLYRTLFLVGSSTVFYTISLWTDHRAIARFGSDPRHLIAVRWTLRNAREIWGSEWRLEGMSPRAQWGGEELLLGEYQ